MRTSKDTRTTRTAEIDSAVRPQCGGTAAAVPTISAAVRHPVPPRQSSDCISASAHRPKIRVDSYALAPWAIDLLLNRLLHVRGRTLEQTKNGVSRLTDAATVVFEARPATLRAQRKAAGRAPRSFEHAPDEISFYTVDAHAQRRRQLQEHFHVAAARVPPLTQSVGARERYFSRARASRIAL